MSLVFSEKLMRTLEQSLGGDLALRITSALGPTISADPVMGGAPEVAAQVIIGIAKTLGPDASADEIVALYRQGRAEALSPGKSTKKKWWRFGR
jgi:hypothetical protein